MTHANEDFHIGAAAFSSDGRHVGEVRRTLVDEGFGLKALVVEESRAFRGHLLAPGALGLEDDLVVPLDSVANVTHDRVDLALTSAQVRALPPYLSYGPAEEPPEGLASRFASVLGGGAMYSTRVPVAMKLEGEIEISAGENVMIGHQGNKLGEVRDVLFDGTELIGIVVEPDGFLKKPVVLPRRFLTRSDDAALFVTITEDEARNLDRFRPTD